MVGCSLSLRAGPWAAGMWLGVSGSAPGPVADVTSGVLSALAGVEGFAHRKLK